jgi:hypothetical protein
MFTFLHRSFSLVKLFLPSPPPPTNAQGTPQPLRQHRDPFASKTRQNYLTPCLARARPCPRQPLCGQIGFCLEVCHSFNTFGSRQAGLFRTLCGSLSSKFASVGHAISLSGCRNLWESAVGCCFSVPFLLANSELYRFATI